jgi:hypothetical protein
VWSVSDVKPGGAERVLASAETVVALGEVGLTHRQLSRGGMVLSGATANPDGRLGAGAKVRAAAAAGSRWDAALPAGRLGVAQAGAQRLVLVELRVCGAGEDAVLAVDEAGAGVRLRAPASAPAGVFRDNLRLLGAAPGLRLLAVGRGAADAAGTVEVLPRAAVTCGCRTPLAVMPISGSTGCHRRSSCPRARRRPSRLRSAPRIRWPTSGAGCSASCPAVAGRSRPQGRRRASGPRWGHFGGPSSPPLPPCCRPS